MSLSTKTILATLLAALLIAPLAAEEKASKGDKSIDLLADDLSAWNFFSAEKDTKMGDVWSLKDGVLTCKGTPLGYISTKKKYKDFTLKLKWRWPANQKPGKGGILVRTTGKDKVWPRCLEAQINVGDAGDFWALDGYSLDGPKERTKKLSHEKFGKLTNIKKIKATEKPAGQWNSYEVVAKGPVVTLKHNGQVVNRSERCEDITGTICLTAEGNGIEFSDVKLIPAD